MKILGLIPARGGSKGVKRKNIRTLCGKPLLAYTATAALESTSLVRVVLSTEDEEIATIGKELGLDVPFIRPIELAQDKTPTLPVIQHALETLQAAGEYFDAVCLLQPTNPLRRTEDINNCVELLITSNADCVISVLPVPHEYNPKWVYFRNEDGSIKLSSGAAEPISRRQDLPAAFHRDGSIYITKTTVLTSTGTLYGENIQPYVMDPDHSLNIDTEADWNRAEEFLTRKFVTGV